MKVAKMKMFHNQPRVKIMVTILLGILLAGCSGRPTGKADQTTGEVPVPDRYRWLYKELYAKLDSLRSSDN